MATERNSPLYLRNEHTHIISPILETKDNIHLPEIKSPGIQPSFITQNDESWQSGKKDAISLQRKIDFFLTEIEDRLESIRKSPHKDNSLYSNPSPTNFSDISLRHISVTPTLKNPPISPLKIQGKILRKVKEKIEKKKSIENLMRSTNEFTQDTEKNEGLIEDLRKELQNTKTPLIESLYSEIQSKENAYDAYRKYGRSKNEYDEDSSLSVFSKKCTEEQIPPLPVLAHAKEHSLILNRYKMNDQLCRAISDSIKTMKNLMQIHLDECGISDQGGANLLKGISTNTNIQSLYYTRNEIGSNFAKELNKMIASAQITEINLNACRFTPMNVVEALKALPLSRTLRKLYISDLGLNNLAMDQVCRVLRKNILTELDLSWNQISSESTKKFLAYLRKNRSLKFLDYSWNNLSSPDSELSIYISQIFSRHPGLLHLNISHTKITDTDAGIIINGLKQSNTLIGLHLTGNKISRKMLNSMILHLGAQETVGMKANSALSVPHPMKFLKRNDYTVDQSTKINLRLRDRMGRSLITHKDNLLNIESPTKDADKRLFGHSNELIFSRMLGKREVKGSSQWILSPHCWICERWVIYDLKISLEKVKNVENINNFNWKKIREICKICLKASFNDWKEIPLELVDETLGKYEISLLLPPGKHYLWFILDGNDVCVTKELSKRTWEGASVNEINIPLRSYELSVSEAENIQVGRVFDKNKSVFRNYIDDTDQTRKIMFDYDSKYYKLPRVIRDTKQLDDVYSVLLANFGEIKEIFLYLSASSNYPSIGWLDFSDFCDQCDMHDKKFLNKAAVDRIFIAVNVELEEKLDDNPDKELCRYEFYEIIVRLALCKYQDLPLTPAQMTEKLLNDHIFKYAMTAKAAKFRKEKLYNLEVNDILEANLSNLQNIFTKYRERLGRWLSFKSIRALVDKAKIIINDDELIKVYAFSKMSILNEMDSDGAHYKMQFVEFLDFLGRLSDLVCNEDIPIYSKLDLILEKILVSNGLRKAKKIQENESGSEIDDD
ncbi:unnamed protein product [Blepharisma stoltei]|uniref:RNI-like protein n=1 Tax=Blepharisma stoltei TaxID=1481888 RepID=A0AAU9IFS5_9CILI|nr:unnamed protein product [Blepharisma stoltei]